jgi:hypothetical protein
VTPPKKSRDERLNELVAIVNGIRWGMPGYDARLVEITGGFPAGGSGGGSKGTVSRPVEAQVIAAMDEHRTDPGAEAQADFDKRLEVALREAERLWDEYTKIAQPRMGSSMVAKPGCELCALVPCGCDRCNAQDHRHHCDALYTVEQDMPAKRKGQQPTKRKVAVCSSCYEFQRADRAGRLPTHDEVLDHVEGRRRRWKVGA